MMNILITLWIEARKGELCIILFRTNIRIRLTFVYFLNIFIVRVSSISMRYNECKVYSVFVRVNLRITTHQEYFARR